MRGILPSQELWPPRPAAAARTGYMLEVTQMQLTQMPAHQTMSKLIPQMPAHHTMSKSITQRSAHLIGLMPAHHTMSKLTLTLSNMTGILPLPYHIRNTLLRK